ncbi:hypothetical protein PROFUN_11519 [Planoprotostelium fungivorum]|uniref:Uncharacterized protein n=1 Tax=Planoprotostelium fungivorum TaxID=1890364 RepID=A0A2P6NA14_9EUKA|nr:hypothetical protein PROFUN_11519 [Planoprotostelium fungivorum]
MLVTSTKISSPRSLLVWVYVGHGRLDNRTLYLGNARHAPTSDAVLNSAESSLREMASTTQERIISINNTAPARSTALIAVHLVEDIQPGEMNEWLEQVTTDLYSHGSIQVKAVEKECSTIAILSVPVFVLLPLLPYVTLIGILWK